MSAGTVPLESRRLCQVPAASLTPPERRFVTSEVISPRQIPSKQHADPHSYDRFESPPQYSTLDETGPRTTAALLRAFSAHRVRRTARQTVPPNSSSQNNVTARVTAAWPTQHVQWRANTTSRPDYLRHQGSSTGVTHNALSRCADGPTALSAIPAPPTTLPLPHGAHCTLPRKAASLLDNV